VFLCTCARACGVCVFVRRDHERNSWESPQETCMTVETANNLKSLTKPAQGLLKNRWCGTFVLAWNTNLMHTPCSWPYICVKLSAPRVHHHLVLLLFLVQSAPNNPSEQGREVCRQGLRYLAWTHSHCHEIREGGMMLVTCQRPDLSLTPLLQAMPLYLHPPVWSYPL
jgi:hypothetical protein